MNESRERRPPLVGRALLRLRKLSSRREEIGSDLEELYKDRRIQRGGRYASLRYIVDAMSLWTHRSRRSAPPVVARQHRGGGWLLDLKFAIRMYRRQFGVLSVTTAGLALAIGITTAIFGFVNAIALLPLGVSDAASVVEVREIYSDGDWSRLFTYPEYQRAHDGVDSVTLEAYVRERAPLGERSDETVRVTLVSGGFFRTLGATAAIGRVLTDADDSADSPPTVVINNTFWRHTFGADETIVGRAVRIMGTAFTVVGVMEEGFRGPTGGAEPPAFWAPLATFWPVWQPSPERELRVYLIGRLGKGASHQQAEAEVSSFIAALAAENPEGDSARVVGARLEQATNQAGGVVWLFTVVMAILSLVLLLACANVATVLLASAISRRGEMGLRLAIGASRWRVMRQLLTESLMLAGLSGGLGLVLAYWLQSAIAGFVESSGNVDLVLDTRVYGFCVLVTVLVGLGAGLSPARYGASGDLASALKGDAAKGAGSGRPGRSRSRFVAVQAATSMVLLVLATLLTRSVVQVSHEDFGFDVDQLLTIDVSFEAAGYDSARAADYWDRVAERIVEMPDVESAALVAYAPYGGTFGRVEKLQSRGHDYTVYFNESSANYFATTGIPILRGRMFTAEEVRSGAPVAVVSENLARALWNAGDAIGESLAPLGSDLSGIQVVGVVADAMALRLEDDAASLYRPFANTAAVSRRLVVRSRVDAGTILTTVLEAVRAIDPQVLPTATTVRAGVERSLQGPRVFATIAGILSVVAVGLASTGIFGVAAFTVEQRSTEIGVRMAIGASTGDIGWLLLRDNMRPVAAGLALGLFAALAGGRLLTAALHGISPHDPFAILAAIAILVGAAALAAALPTRRSARVDPAAVLRRG